MSQVQISEVVEALLDENSLMFRTLLAARIESEGIAPPDGYVIVPIEPTAEMVLATNGLTYRPYDDAVEFYKVMLTAAPKPEVKP